MLSECVRDARRPPGGSIATTSSDFYRVASGCISSKDNGRLKGEGAPDGCRTANQGDGDREGQHQGEQHRLELDGGAEDGERDALRHEFAQSEAHQPSHYCQYGGFAEKESGDDQIVCSKGLHESNLAPAFEDGGG